MPAGIGYPDSTGQGFEEDDARRAIQKSGGGIMAGQFPTSQRPGAPFPGQFPPRGPFPGDNRGKRRFPRPGPGLPPMPKPEFFDEESFGGAGQGFLTPFGETTPQRARNEPDQLGGRQGQAFDQFKAQDPLTVYKDIVDKASLGIKRDDFLDKSPFQQFMLMERARRKLGIKGRPGDKRGPGRPPNRPRPFPFPRPQPFPDRPQRPNHLSRFGNKTGGFAPGPDGNYGF